MCHFTNYQTAKSNPLSKHIGNLKVSTSCTSDRGTWGHLLHRATRWVIDGMVWQGSLAIPTTSSFSAANSIYTCLRLGVFKLAGYIVIFFPFLTVNPLRSTSVLGGWDYTDLLHQNDTSALPTTRGARSSIWESFGPVTFPRNKTQIASQLSNMLTKLEKKV